jgi:hypothetical protein
MIYATCGKALLKKRRHHPHIHYVIPSGGLSPDHQRIQPPYPFPPVKVHSRVFRGNFVVGLKQAFADGKLLFPGSLKGLGEQKAFHSFLRPLFRHGWWSTPSDPSVGPRTDPVTYIAAVGMLVISALPARVLAGSARHTCGANRRCARGIAVFFAKIAPPIQHQLEWNSAVPAGLLTISR